MHSSSCIFLTEGPQRGARISLGTFNIFWACLSFTKRHASVSPIHDLPHPSLLPLVIFCAFQIQYLIKFMGGFLIAMKYALTFTIQFVLAGDLS